ncbi:LPXTG cell wall anchor domain-containing protein, partial [Salmonella enterica]|nr:LPXTG cell wall anchor domain-containing protein [Salmonella enterica]
MTFSILLKYSCITRFNFFIIQLSLSILPRTGGTANRKIVTLGFIHLILSIIFFVHFIVY